MKEQTVPAVDPAKGPPLPNWLSPTLARDRNAALDFRIEAVDYMSRVLAERQTMDQALMAGFTCQLEFPPETETITAIPVHVLEPHLERTLADYARQEEALTHHQFVIFLNADKRISQGYYKGSNEYQKGLKVQLNKIKALKKRFPRFHINVLQFQFGEVTMGTIRGLLIDAIVAGALIHRLKDPIVISNDADCLSIPPDYLAQIKNQYKEDALLDVLAGPVFWGGYGPSGESHLPGQTKIPELYLGQRLVEVIESLSLDREDGRNRFIKTAGPNFSFRLSAYCALGGYEYPTGAFATKAICDKAALMRSDPDVPLKDHPATLQFSEGAYVVTNPRRALHTLLGGRMVSEQIFSFESLHGANLDLPELIRRYEDRSDLLQLADIRKARQGNTVAFKKMKDRLKVIFLQSALSCNIPTREVLNCIAQRLGIRLRKASFIESRLDDVEVDWAKSPLVQFLYQWASK